MERGFCVSSAEPRLGRYRACYELVPRMIEALVRKTVSGVSAGTGHTAVWTEAGELFTFGRGYRGRLALGHGGQENEFVPRLVEALAGKRVIGAAPRATVVYMHMCNRKFKLNSTELALTGAGGQLLVTGCGWGGVFPRCKVKCGDEPQGGCRRCQARVRGKAHRMPMMICTPARLDTRATAKKTTQQNKTNLLR